MRVDNVGVCAYLVAFRRPRLLRFGEIRDIDRSDPARIDLVPLRGHRLRLPRAEFVWEEFENFVRLVEERIGHG